MESTDSSMTSGGGGGGPQLPPGFRFHPTDEELVVHYLKKKAQSTPLPVAIIAEVDLYKFDPWELPAKATFGEQEWYFFTPRDRKYPNGARPNRAATSGYWKATGTDKPVLTSGGAQKVGVKKALVFYGGKPPKGEKTNWIMHEYRLADNKPSSSYDPAKKRGSLRLDDWVLCRIYKKNSHKPVDNDHSEHFMTDNDIPMPQGLNSHQNHEHNLFDEMLEPTRTTIGSSLSLPALPIIEGSTPTANSYLHKRTLPFLYWNEDEMATRCKRTAETITDQSEARTFDVNTMANQDNNSSSMAAGLISQLQLAGEGGQTQAMLPGPLGEGVLRQPYQLSGLNWYT